MLALLYKRKNKKEISEDFRLENGQVCLYMQYLVSTYVVVYSWCVTTTRSWPRLRLGYYSVASSNPDVQGQPLGGARGQHLEEEDDLLSQSELDRPEGLLQPSDEAQGDEPGQHQPKQSRVCTGRWSGGVVPCTAPCFGALALLAALLMCVHTVNCFSFHTES